MADLEATGSNATVYLRSTTGTDSADDYRLRREPTPHSINIEYYDGSSWIPTLVTNGTADVFTPNGGIAAGSTARTNAIKWKKLVGSLGATGTDTITTGTTNKIFLVLVALYNQQTGKWDMYDYLATSTGGFSVYFTRAGGGDSVTVTYNGNYNNQNYQILVIYDV